MKLIEEIIGKLLDNGIEITLKKENGVIKYDLNTGMKSTLIISEGSFGTIKCESRYDHSSYADDYRDILHEVKYCLHGRDFMNQHWEKLLLKEGLLTKTITTEVSYS